jgi:hypothetical protein
VGLWFLSCCLLLLSFHILYSFPAASPALIQRCSDAEERYTQGQADLNQVSTFLDNTRTLNSSLNAQLDSEKMAHVVDFPDCFCFAPFASMLSSLLACRRRGERFLLLVTIWIDYIVMLEIP